MNKCLLKIKKLLKGLRNFAIELLKAFLIGIMVKVAIEILFEFLSHM